MHIVAPIAHTLNRSGACPGTSFSVPDCQMYMYVYNKRLASQPTESVFIVNAERPAALPAVTAAAKKGRASKPFAEHASARNRRPRSCLALGGEYAWAGLCLYFFVYIGSLERVREASRAVAIEELGAWA
jgi:hypothetical protein